MGRQSKVSIAAVPLRPPSLLEITLRSSIVQHEKWQSFSYVTISLMNHLCGARELLLGSKNPNWLTVLDFRHRLEASYTNLSLLVWFKVIIFQQPHHMRWERRIRERITSRDHCGIEHSIYSRFFFSGVLFQASAQPQEQTGGAIGYTDKSKRRLRYTSNSLIIKEKQRTILEMPNTNFFPFFLYIVKL